MKLLVTLLSTLILVACGGGGGGGSPAVATGQFTDSPVKGLQYRTASQSGETNANGEFRYLPGESVTFFVGDITLGAAVGAAKVTPFDLAGISPPTTVPSSGQTTVAFDQAINLAVFLQTLDADGNAANGIEIPAQIRTLASSSPLDFKLSRDSFAGSLPLRKLVAAGRTSGLWGGTKAIRTPALAVKAMYATLGITPVMDLITKIEAIDPNSSKVLSRVTNTYDANGNLTQEVSELDNNGVLEAMTATFAYDAQGHQTQYSWEQTINGALVRSTTIVTFDANGHAVHDETDTDGDGRVDNWNNTTVNVNGDPTLMTFEYDNTGDGVVDGVVTLKFTYNADGYLTTSRAEYDNNNDGIVDSFSSMTNAYDDKGKLTLTESDENGDGVVDIRTTYAYDAKGNMTLFEEDSNGDGIVDIRSTASFDANGQVTLSEEDHNGDGTIDRRITTLYDAKGNRIRRDRDSNGDGIVDLRTVYTYDADGKLVLTEDDVGADGIVDQQTTYVHLKVAG